MLTSGQEYTRRTQMTILTSGPKTSDGPNIAAPQVKQIPSSEIPWSSFSTQVCLPTSTFPFCTFHFSEFTEVNSDIAIALDSISRLVDFTVHSGVR